MLARTIAALALDLLGKYPTPRKAVDELTRKLEGNVKPILPSGGWHIDSTGASTWVLPTYGRTIVLVATAGETVTVES